MHVVPTKQRTSQEFISIARRLAALLVPVKKKEKKENTFTFPLLGFIIYSAVPAIDTTELEDGQRDRSNYLELH